MLSFDQIYVWYAVDRLCGLVVRVPGHTTEMYSVSCEVRTEFIYVMQTKVHRLCGIVVSVPGYRSRDPGSIPGATRFFWEVVDLKQGPFSLVSTTEELLERWISGSDLKSREYDRRDSSRCQSSSLYQQKLALTPPTRGDSSVGIVRSRTQATEFSFCFRMYPDINHKFLVFF
jgi:hypothetical protein